MTRITLAAATAVATLSAGCVPPPPPVELAATPESAAALTGKWEGEYSSSETGRSGSIVFELTSSGDSAFGEVVMIPEGWGRPLHPARYPPDPVDIQAQPTEPELLTIEFVWAEGNHLSGSLSLYQDPECGCTLLTTFVGEVKGDVIEGTFSSQHSESGRVQGGRWKVTRKS